MSTGACSGRWPSSTSSAPSACLSSPASTLGAPDDRQRHPLPAQPDPHGLRVVDVSLGRAPAPGRHGRPRTGDRRRRPARHGRPAVRHRRPRPGQPGTEPRPELRPASAASSRSRPASSGRRWWRPCSRCSTAAEPVDDRPEADRRELVHGRAGRSRRTRTAAAWRWPRCAPTSSRCGVVTADGALVECSRTRNAELFSLVLGGYGLFGAIATVTLRLTERQKLERVVEIATVPDLVRRDRGSAPPTATATATSSSRSTRPRRASCTAASSPATARWSSTAPIPGSQRAFTAEDWQNMLLLAHVDKSRAYEAYAGHYLATSASSTGPTCTRSPTTSTTTTTSSTRGCPTGPAAPR